MLPTGLADVLPNFEACYPLPMSFDDLWTSFLRFSHLLNEPLALLVNPAKRAFLPFLAGAAVLASLVWAVKCRSKGSLRSFLFPKSIWLHPSALLDYRLAFVRAVLGVVLVVPFAVSIPHAGFAVARWLWKNAGILPALPIGDTAVIALFSVAVFCADDFSRYCVHRLSHRIPALWELHKVHHSAQVLTPFSIYRTHPIESVLMRAGSATATALTVGVFLWLFPGRVRAFEIYGVYALSFVWNALGSNLRHSHVWLSYGPFVERLFISPAQHQMHHSLAPRHHGTNYGSALAVWDLLGGTLLLAGAKRQKLSYGLSESERNHEQTVLSAFVSPMLAAARALVPRRIRRT